jgi:hypothetical protein
METGRGRLIRWVLRLRCVFLSVDVWFLIASRSLSSSFDPVVPYRTRSAVDVLVPRPDFAVARLPWPWPLRTRVPPLCILFGFNATTLTLGNNISPCLLYAALD